MRMARNPVMARDSLASSEVSHTFDRSLLIVTLRLLRATYKFKISMIDGR